MLSDKHVRLCFWTHSSEHIILQSDNAMVDLGVRRDFLLQISRFIGMTPYCITMNEIIAISDPEI